MLAYGVEICKVLHSKRVPFSLSVVLSLLRHKTGEVREGERNLHNDDFRILCSSSNILV
jgi:hypothetical protein